MALGFLPQAATLAATLNVYAQTQLFLAAPPGQLSQTFAVGSVAPVSFSMPLTSSADPAPFSASVSVPSGGKWLSVSPSQGQTPATLIATFNPAALTTASDTGSITVKGPANSISVQVSFQAPPGFGLTPALLTFFAQSGTSSPAAQDLVSTGAYGPYAFNAQTSSGGNWLSAATNTGPGAAIAVVSVNPSGLAAGIYQGTVTVIPAAPAVVANVPVTLTVYSTPPAVTASPTAVTLNRASYNVNVLVATGAVPLTYDLTVATTSGGNWLAAGLNPAVGNQFLTPGSIYVTTMGLALPAGIYAGSVTVRAPAGSSNTVTIPVTYNAPVPTPVPPPAPQPNIVPVVTGVFNGGSELLTSVAPGEIVTIFGQGIGPNTPVGFALGPDGKVATTLGGTQVMFDGRAAPLIYASATQVNAIVPYEVSSGNATGVSVTIGGSSVVAGSYGVVSASPGVFTVGSAGVGQGAVLNQDDSVNGAANPAARGTIIQIFLTGAGALSPAGVTGEVTGSVVKTPLLPVTVTIGGVSAPVMFAGAAPDAVSGLLQVNAVVPTGAAPGSVPIAINVGTAVGQSNVTVALK
jgi:trimeric autotransporter adhesin